MKGLSTCFFIMLVSACSTQPAVKANYYLLNEASEHSAMSTDSNSKDGALIVLEKIKLSGYLTQPNIAMQLADHQLYFSNNHIWAEKLEYGITKSLLHDLNKKSLSTRFISKDSPVKNQSSARLILEVEHFIATSNSDVILSGQYWIISNKDNDGMNINIKQDFHLSLTLEKDGYPHSVSKMRQLITDLSTEIVELSDKN